MRARFPSGSEMSDDARLSEYKIPPDFSDGSGLESTRIPCIKEMSNLRPNLPSAIK